MDTNKVYGINAIEEALNSSTTIEKLFVLKGSNNERLNFLVQKVKTQGTSISYTPIEKLNKLAKGGNHQGAVALISPITYHELESLIENTLKTNKNPLFLLLDQISDVRNFGAIIRTAACTNVDGIIVQKKGGAPVNADAIKTSAGGIFKVPICKVDHIKDAIYYLQSSDITVLAATEKTETLLYDKDLTKGIAFIMGSEGRGINPSVLKIVDDTIKIPISEKMDSLNVSVASAILLYEATRQRMMKN